MHWILFTLFGLGAALPAVKLPNGEFEGLHDKNTSTTVYYSVPFATAQRFAAPKPIANNNATYNASKHGSACINFNLPPPYDIGFGTLLGSQPANPQSEDCLSLDVYVPDGGHCDLPVLFYTPGGGFLVGASFLYDMRPMVERSAKMGKPFIGVSINYRLGPLGFLNPSSGEKNVGILDQLEALRYVERNIHAFGGDPKRITIMGQSAGAASTMFQLLGTEVSVRGAWMASVPSSYEPFTYDEPRDKDELVKSYAAACGCPNQTIDAAVECLTRTDTAVLVNQSVAWEGSSVGFGGPIQQNVFQQIHAGHFPPVVVSVCRDEGTSQAIGFNASNDATTSIAIEMFANIRPTAYRKFLSEMLEAYPNDPAVGCPFDGRNTTYNQPAQYKRMSAIVTDTVYIQAWTEYLRRFDRAWGVLFEEPLPESAPELGVQHASDIPFYFPLINGPEHDPRSHGYADLVEVLQSAVIRFVVDGSPGDWPRGDRVLSVNRHRAIPVKPPHRPGFGVLSNYLRPKGG